jgi:Tfp pilus assembly protein FimT
MQVWRQHRHAEQGFTVAEVLVAVSVLTFVVVGVIGAIQFAATATAQTTARERAINLGSEVIERARNTPYDSVGTKTPLGVYGDPPGDILTTQTQDDFTIQTEITYQRDPVTNRATYKNVTVVVSWERPRANSVKLETAVMGKSTLTNTGDILVAVLDSDSSMPVPGVTIAIDPASGSNRTAYTDANGEAFFGYVSMGAVTFTANKTGYLIDPSPLAGATIAADALASYTLYAQEPSTGVVTVTGSDGQPIAGATVALEGASAPTGAMTRTTNAAGQATFDNLFKGSHDVSVSASGRVPGTAVLDVTAGGQTVTLDVTLADPNQLTVSVVRSPGGQPLTGATVRVQGPSPSVSNITGSPATSASSGLATFDLPAAGSYLITVSMSGYTTQTRSITVTASGLYSETFSMVAPTSGDLVVTVTSSGGAPRANAQVRVTGRDGIVYDVTRSTDSDGVALFSSLLPGRYYVRARRWISGSSYGTWSSNVTVTIAVGATTSLTVVRN